MLRSTFPTRGELSLEALTAIRTRPAIPVDLSGPFPISFNDLSSFEVAVVANPQFRKSFRIRNLADKAAQDLVLNNTRDAFGFEYALELRHKDQV